MFSESKKSDELEDPNNGARVERAESCAKDVKVLWDISRAEGRCCEMR